MDRFAVNCSRSIHTKVYYCTFISHYDRHQRVLARWNDAIVVLFVFVVVSSFFLNFFLSLPWVCLFSPFHGFALHIIRISSNTIGTRLIVSVTAAGRIISCDSCMWCRFSVLVYTGTTMLLACFVFFLCLTFSGFPLLFLVLLFHGVTLHPNHISISDYHSELPFRARSWSRY